MVCFESMAHPKCNWRAVKIEKMPDDYEDGLVGSEVDSGNVLTKNSLIDCGASVEPSEIVFTTCAVGSLQSQYFTVTCTDETILLNVFLVSVTMPYTLFIDEKPVTTGSFPLTLTKGYPLMVKVVLKAQDIGRNETFCRFEFEKGCVLNKISSQVFCPDELLLDTEDNFVRSTNGGGNNKQYMRQNSKNANWVVPGIKPIYSSKAGTPAKLPSCSVPQKYYSAMENGRDMTIVCPEILLDLTGKNYASKFHALLYIEEVQAEMEMLVYNMSGVLLRPENEYLYMDVPGLSEGRPSLLVGDRIIVTETHDITGSSPRHEAYIHKVTANTIFLRFNEGFHSRYDGYAVDVQFVPNRNSFRKAHLAVQYSSTSFPTWLLFPQWLGERRPLFVPMQKNSKIIPQSKWLRSAFSYGHQINVPFSTPVVPILHGGIQNAISKNKHCIARKVPNLAKFEIKLMKNIQNQDSFFINQKLNERQKIAVRRILAAECRPTPYILFGPPGTGKTITVVESILQVFVNISDSRILACTPSNSAADLIVERLKDSGVVGLVDVIRFNAANRSLNSIPENILRFCCNDLDEVETISRYRIIVCTCTTAGNFYPLELQQGHFTHVFVDEAAQATEPETMIAVGLTVGNPEAVTILAGDPKQLGPVLRSTIAESYGLGESFLGRLAERKLYRRDESAFGAVGNYNPKVMTKLVINYRSHPCLLAMPSKIFYDDELIAEGDKDLTEVFVGWEHLPNANFPFIFFGVRGKDQRENDSPSWFNPGEVVQVVKYVKLILDAKIAKAADIGIITPYKKQVEKIRQFSASCEIEKIKVGSVEEFQGQERQVILLSTVRSDESKVESDIYHNLGFLSNPRRFNVATTRAHSLLIIVGNPFVLVQDPYWKSIIQYALLNNCYTGCDPPEKHLKDSDRFNILLQQSDLSKSRENVHIENDQLKECGSTNRTDTESKTTREADIDHGCEDEGLDFSNALEDMVASNSEHNLDADDEASIVTTEESTVSVNLAINSQSPEEDTVSFDASSLPKFTDNSNFDSNDRTVLTEKLLNIDNSSNAVSFSSENSNENSQPLATDSEQTSERRVRFANTSDGGGIIGSGRYNTTEAHNSGTEYYSEIFHSPQEQSNENKTRIADRSVNSASSSEKREVIGSNMGQFEAEHDSLNSRLKPIPFVCGCPEDMGQIEEKNRANISSVVSMSTDEFMLLQSSPKIPVSVESAIIDVEKLDSTDNDDFVPDTTTEESSSCIVDRESWKKFQKLHKLSSQHFVTDGTTGGYSFETASGEHVSGVKCAKVSEMKQVTRFDPAELVFRTAHVDGLLVDISDDSCQNGGKMDCSSANFSSSNTSAMASNELVKKPENVERNESSMSFTPTSISSITANTSVTTSSIYCLSSTSWLEDSEETQNDDKLQVMNLVVDVPDTPTKRNLASRSQESNDDLSLVHQNKFRKLSNIRQDTLNTELDMQSAGYFSDHLLDMSAVTQTATKSSEFVNSTANPTSSRSDSIVDSVRGSSGVCVSDTDLSQFLASENSERDDCDCQDYINSENQS